MREEMARTVFWRYKRAAAVRKAVRHGEWKYVNDNGEEALHHLGKDSGETANLLGQEEKIANDLRARLARWERDVQSPRLRDFSRSTA